VPQGEPMTMSCPTVEVMEPEPVALKEPEPEPEPVPVSYTGAMVARVCEWAAQRGS